MYGAILGDMIGAPYELDMGNKSKVFPLFGRSSQFTDDTVMTVAVAEALMDSVDKSDDEIRAALVASMRNGAMNIRMRGTDRDSMRGSGQRI